MCKENTKKSKALGTNQKSSAVVKKSCQFINNLKTTVERNGKKVFATWYDHHGKPTSQYTYEQIWAEAGAIAHILRVDMKLEKGDRVVLCYSFGLQFFATFLGCIRAGITAVLVYPPNPASLSLTIPKITVVAEDCDAKLILVDSTLRMIRRADRINLFSKFRHLWPENIQFEDLHPKVKNKALSSVSYDDTTVTESDLAFLQYTSGSTGKPKGVMVSYGAVEANVNAILSYAKVECDNAGVSFCDATTLSWVPQYHDMGLIGASIAPFAAGWSCNMFSPITFVQNPVLYIELMSRLKVNFSLGPDFGYNLAARKFNERKNRLGGKEPIPNLDLSSIIVLQNGAEPIRHETVELFEKTFQQYKLNKRWFSAIYGMAEMVVCISSLRELHLSRFEPTPGRRSVAVAHRSTLPDGQDLRIVCPLSCKELKDGSVGEIWLSGPSAALGYFNQPSLTLDVFQAQISDRSDEKKTFLRTGDLGFFEDDYLFICGRSKDLVIMNGVNYYPQDIEVVVQNASPAVHPGCIAAFSSDDTNSDGKLVVVFEIRNAHAVECKQVMNEVHGDIVRKIGLVPSRVVAIKERAIPKTTSGKIQRKATRLVALKNDELPIVDQLVSAHSGSAPSVPVDLPTDVLPQFVLEIVKSIQVDHGMLERYFYEFRVDTITGMKDAWDKTDKSTIALQSMCDEIISGLISKHPSVVQFAHLLATNPDWILVDPMELLMEIVHYSFVLEWITKRLVGDVNLLEEKLKLDEEHEGLMLQDVDKDASELPEDAQFFAGGQTHDALFAAVDIFAYMKMRSVKQCCNRFIAAIKGGPNTLAIEEEEMDWFTLNLLEATWLDRKNGRYDSACVGQWLCTRSLHHNTIDLTADGTVNVSFDSTDKLERVYTAWNMAVMLSFPNTALAVAKLLMPCMINVQPNRSFLPIRVISLHLALQIGFDQEMCNETIPCGMASSASLGQGLLSKRCMHSTLPMMRI